MSKKKFNMDDFLGKVLVKAVKDKKVDIDVGKLIEVPDVFLHRLDESFLKKTNDAERANKDGRKDEADFIDAVRDASDPTGTLRKRGK